MSGYVLVRWTLVAIALLGIGGQAAADESPEGRYRIYVSNEQSGDLSVIDSESLQQIKVIPVGNRPRHIAMGPDGRILYVGLNNPPVVTAGDSDEATDHLTKDGIGIVDLARGRIVKVLQGVADPQQLAVSFDGERVYAASRGTGKAVVQHVETGEVLAFMEVGEDPQGIAISPDGDLVYVTSEKDHRITVVDTDTLRVLKQFSVTMRPHGVAFSPDGRHVYVVGSKDASMTVVDARTHDVIRNIPLPYDDEPTGVAVSPDGQRVYVTLGTQGMLVTINARTFAVIESRPVGNQPRGVAISPDGERLFTANAASNDVTVVSAGGEIIARVPVGREPFGVVVAPLVLDEQSRGEVPAHRLLQATQPHHL